MKAIVSIHRFDSGDQFSMTTSCGATVNQALRSNNPLIQNIMDEWVGEALAKRSLILEINRDLADTLLKMDQLGEYFVSTRLPADLKSELLHKFPDLGAIYGKRNPTESSGQSAQAKVASTEAAPAQGNCERQDQA
jgi:hypothetical protein